MVDSIRVAMIIQGYHPRIGGAEKQLGAVAPELQKQQVEVHVLTRRYQNLPPFETIDGVAVHRLPIPGIKPTASIGFTLAAMPVLRRLRPDVIHAHEMFSPATTAILAKKLFGTPVVVTAHRSGALGDVERLKRKTLGAQRVALFRDTVDAFAVISREIDDELAAIGVPAAHRVFIPNGVDTRTFAPLAADDKRTRRAALGLPDVPIALFAGRLAQEKRLDLLVGVWQAIRAQVPGAMLVLVGAGAEEAALKRMAGAGVLFTGATHDVAPYLQAADLFVLPSAYEGLSVALLEAMAAGLPAVATRVGGNPEVITHGENGWLIPVDDPAALQAALIAVLGDARYCANLGCQARARIVRDYEIAGVAQKLRAMYLRLLEARRAQN